MRERPIEDLAAALRALGAGVEVLGRAGCPPLRVAGGGLPGGRARIDARRSSQYVSAVLLAAPCAARDVELDFVDGAVVSRAFLELTADVMRAFGAELELLPGGAPRARADPTRRATTPSSPTPSRRSTRSPPPRSPGAGCVVEGIPRESRQTDLRVLDVLERMGCRVRADAGGHRALRAPGAAARPSTST